MTWEKFPNVAMYKWAGPGSTWDNEIERGNYSTLAEAQARAVTLGATFFFYMRDSMFLEAGEGCEAKGQFNPGDAVFFNELPWWGSAPQADAYLNSVDNPYQIEIEKDEIGFITCVAISSTAQKVTLDLDFPVPGSELTQIVFEGQDGPMAWNDAQHGGGGDAFLIPAEHNPVYPTITFEQGGEKLIVAKEITSTPQPGLIEHRIFACPAGENPSVVLTIIIKSPP